MAVAAPAGSDTAPPRRARFGPFAFIVMALVLGVACGLFFGEYCGFLSVAGEAYVGLLQMTVLPYIVFSLTANIGRLSIGESKRLAITSLAVLGLLWAIGLATLLLVPFALPRWEIGSFFSTSLLDPVQKVDFLSLFIPSNPFRSLSQNLAPAVVVFCILFGFALITIRDKEPLLDVLDTVNATLSRVNSFVVKISPIGIFAISASATGTLTLEEFGRLQAYLIIFTAAVLLLTLWVLPMLVACLTPFRYRDVLAASRNALVTAFVVGSVFVVIPMLVDSVKELMQKYESETAEAEPTTTSTHPEFIIPLAYPFPNLGKIVTLLFVPFAAWFYGQPMALGEYPLLLGTGLFMSFGKVTTTIPFLLDMQEVPSDIFQLFLMSSVVAGRFSDLLGGMHLLAFTLLVTCAMSGLLKLKRAKLAAAAGVTAALCLGFVASTQVALKSGFTGSFDRQTILAGMHLMEKQVPAKILSYGAPHPVALKAGLTRIGRMEKTGKLRIGFHPDKLPFSYYNAKGELVGFDIDIAHRLARELNVALEFVPFAVASVMDQLEDDHFDIAMSGIAATVARAAKLNSISAPYMNVTLALVVRDSEKSELSDIAALRGREKLTIGAEAGSYFGEKIRELLPNAKVVELWSESQFFEGPPQYMDALVTSAEVGAAWTLVHPRYAVVNPLDRKIGVPLVYLVAGQDQQLEDFLERWIRLKRQDGTISDLYKYWILGRGAEVKKPRWSIARDVLHWID